MQNERVLKGEDHCLRQELKVINCLFNDHKRVLTGQSQVTEVANIPPSGDLPYGRNILSCVAAFERNKARLGVVLRNCHGNVLKRWLKPCEASSALDAELKAYEFVVRLSLPLESPLVVEGDSKVCMEALSARVPRPDWTVTSSFLHTVAAIMDPSRIVFRWILAHELAHKALFRNVETLKEKVPL